MFNYSAQLERVIDGDTVDVIIDLGFSIKYSCRVRLLGINAPESRTRDLKEKARGLAAKKRLEEILGDHDLTISTQLDARGKYGRVLGKIWTHPCKTCVNDMMVTEGHAVPYIR